MAGDWIKMRLDLQTHPKVVRILSATKADKFRVIGGLHAVWSVFDTHSADGRLPGYTADTMDHIIGWPGFANAMIAVGWLGDDDGQALVLPEFSEHNGKSGKRRAEDQKRKRDDRKDLQPVRILSANEPDAEWTREEKRREEETTGAAAPGGDSSDDERRKKRAPTEADFDVARWLFDAKRKVNPEAKQPKWETWANEVRLLREVDGRTHRQICELFKWAKADSFWSPNIQSPAKLREKWDTLIEKRALACPNEGEPAKKDWL